MGDFVKKWWPSALTVGVVCYATLFPHPVGADEFALFPGYDKLLHAIMMGGTLSALLFDLRRSGGTITPRIIIIDSLFVCAFAVLDEFLQNIFAPNRTFDVWDILAGIGGVLLAAVLAPPVINKIFRKK